MIAIGTAVIAILFLVLLITVFKWNTFLSFLVVSLGLGLVLGVPMPEVTAAIQRGMGNTLGFLIIILSLGAMLGKLVADSGAAQRISDTLTDLFPKRWVRWGVMLTGFIVGIPLFYSVGFVIMLPLVFGVAASTRLPILYIGLPMLSALSVTHGYLPPHPAPTALVESYGADLGYTLLLGMVVAIPAIIVGGPIFASTLRNVPAKPLSSLYKTERLSAEEMPSFAISATCALLPVIILAGGTVMTYSSSDESVMRKLGNGMADPIFAMLASVLIAIFALGIRRGKSMASISSSFLEAIQDIAMILLIIAGAGALKEIWVVTEVSDQIGNLLQGVDASPLVIAWGIAAVIRLSIGSATVAGLTAAGIAAPLISLSDANPNLMVLATGAGSLMFSHVNDGGFWLFKEYFGLSIRDTIRTWSVMESIVSIMGLLGVLVLNQFI